MHQLPGSERLRERENRSRRREVDLKSRRLDAAGDRSDEAGGLRPVALVLFLLGDAALAAAVELEPVEVVKDRGDPTSPKTSMRSFGSLVSPPPVYASEPTAPEAERSTATMPS